MNLTMVMEEPSIVLKCQIIEITNGMMQGAMACFHISAKNEKK